MANRIWIKLLPPDPVRPPNRPARIEQYRDPLQMGFTIVGTSAAFGGIGWWLDSTFHTFPVLMALGAVLGLFGIIYLTYMRLKEADEAEKRAKSAEDSPSQEVK